MLVLCPNCRRKSRVKNPPASLTTLKIRCAVCKHVFVPVASDLEEETAAPVASATDSGFRGTTKSVDVSDIVRQSFVGPNPLRTSIKTDIALSAKPGSDTGFVTKTSFVGGAPRAGTDVSLTAPQQASSLLPPAPVTAPPARGAPVSKSAIDIQASLAQGAPLSLAARAWSWGALTVLSVGLIFSCFVVPRLSRWRLVGREIPDAKVVAASEVSGLELTAAQFVTWVTGDGASFVVVLGSATVMGGQPLPRPDIVLRLVDEKGVVQGETRAPFGVSPEWVDVVAGRTAPAINREVPWLGAKGRALGLLPAQKTLGFRIALALPLEAPGSYRREAFLVASGAQPGAK